METKMERLKMKEKSEKKKKKRMGKGDNSRLFRFLRTAGPLVGRNGDGGHLVFPRDLGLCRRGLGRLCCRCLDGARCLPAYADGRRDEPS